MVAVRLAAAGVICIAFGNFHLFGGGGGGWLTVGRGLCLPIAFSATASGPTLACVGDDMRNLITGCGPAFIVGWVWCFKEMQVRTNNPDL